MKKILLFIILCYSNTLYSQNKILPTKEFTKQESILSNVFYFKKINTKNFVYQIFIYNNDSGSASFEGSDEVSSNILIFKIEYGENEKPVTYVIKNLIAPKFITLVNECIEIESMKKKRVRELYTLE